MNIFKCYAVLYMDIAQDTDIAKSLEGSGFVRTQWFRIHHTGISGASQAYSSLFYTIPQSNRLFCWTKIYKYSQYRNKLRNCMCTVTYIIKITNLRIWVHSKIFMMGPFQNFLLSGTHSLRGSEADTPLTLPSKITFLLIYYQCCGSGSTIRCLFDP
jgi:hypothetical protein